MMNKKDQAQAFTHPVFQALGLAVYVNYLRPTECYLHVTEEEETTWRG